MDRINEIIRLEGIQDAEGTGEAYLPPNSVDRFVAQKICLPTGGDGKRFQASP